MKALIIVALFTLVVSCSSEDVAPVALKQAITTTSAAHAIEAGEFHIYLFGADTITFTSIVPNPGLVGSFDYDLTEGTPGKFKNSEYLSGGKLDELLTIGRITINALTPGQYIDITYDVTYRDGRRAQGSYNGKIKTL